MTTAKKFVVAFALLLVLLCGGLLIYSGVSGSPAISVSDIWGQIFPSAQLELYGEEPYQLPRITGFGREDDINARLAGYYSPVIDVLHGANADGDILSVSYVLDRIDGGYRLCAQIDSIFGMSLYLPDASLSDNGDLTLPDIPDLSYLSDSGFARGYFAMMVCGVDIDPARADDEIDTAEMCSLMVDYYEKITGSGVDTSRFPADKEGDDEYHKALALGLCSDNYPIYSEADCTNVYRLADSSAELLRRLSFEYCGHSSQTVDTDELYTDSLLFARIYDLNDDSNYIAGYTGRLPDAIRSGHTACPYANKLTRADIAEIYTGIFEDLFGEINYRYYFISQTDVNEEDTVICKAASMHLLPDTPADGLFSPEFIVNADCIPGMAENFAEQCYCQWMYDESEIADPSMTYGDVAAALGLIDQRLRTLGRPITDTVEVINDREYDWYRTQHDTGEYQYVNCMPAITAMAIKWYDSDSDVTVRQLRDRLLDEADDGWYMSQVTDSLDYYGIPNTSCKDIEEGIVHELNRGHIILTQESEKSYNESGHCFVIYGYRKVGDSVWYYIHDPDVSYEDNIYGEPAGKGMVFDSAYAEWIMERITFYFVSVGD